MKCIKKLIEDEMENRNHSPHLYSFSTSLFFFFFFFFSLVSASPLAMLVDALKVVISTRLFKSRHSKALQKK